MKNILLLLSFLLIAGTGFSQVKVFGTGNTMVGNTATTPTAKLEVNVTATSAGTPMFEVEDPGNGFFRIIEGSSGSGKFIPLFDFKGTGVPGFPGAARGVVTTDALYTAGAAFTIIGSNSAGGALSSANLFMIRNSGTARLTVNANGNVGINRTSASEKLHVQGNILASGTVTAMSDRRLKKNIKTYSKGLKEVLEISPVTFQYNGNGGMDDTESTHVGIIAQEFQKISPESIKPVFLQENEAENNAAALSFLKSNATEIAPTNLKEVVKNEYLSVSDKAITYMLVNAVQEQQEMIDAQTAKINELSEIITKLGANGVTNVTEVELQYFDFAEIGLAYPNPTEDYTNIEYTIPTDAKTAKMNIMDNSGRLIRVVNLDQRGQGIVRLDVNQIPGGTYNYQLIVDGRNIGTKKMVVAK